MSRFPVSWVGHLTGRHSLVSFVSVSLMPLEQIHVSRMSFEVILLSHRLLL